MKTDLSQVKHFDEGLSSCTNREMTYRVIRAKPHVTKDNTLLHNPGVTVHCCRQYCIFPATTFRLHRHRALDNIDM